MSLFDEEPKTPSRQHRIGEDLADISSDELRERISQLKDEIARLEQELEAKGSSKAAAEAFFRR